MEKDDIEEETGDDTCQICYSDVSAKFLQPETKNLFNIIHCLECNVRVHHICHGLSTPLKESKKNGKKNGFLCARCKTIPDPHKYVNHLSFSLNNFLEMLCM